MYVIKKQEWPTALADMFTILKVLNVFQIFSVVNFKIVRCQLQYIPLQTQIYSVVNSNIFHCQCQLQYIPLSAPINRCQLQYIPLSTPI